MDRKDLCLLIIVVVLTSGTDAMSRQQLKNSGKMLKKTCMGKNPVTEDQIGEIDKGKFIEEKSVMCYIACIYQMLQIVKNNKLNYEASIKQIEIMYPPDMKEAAKASVDNCKNVSKKYKDLCDASYWTAKCIAKNFIRMRCKDFGTYYYKDSHTSCGIELSNAEVGSESNCITHNHFGEKITLSPVVETSRTDKISANVEGFDNRVTSEQMLQNPHYPPELFKGSWVISKTDKNITQYAEIGSEVEFKDNVEQKIQQPCNSLEELKKVSWAMSKSVEGNNDNSEISRKIKSNENVVPDSEFRPTNQPEKLEFKQEAHTDKPVTLQHLAGVSSLSTVQPLTASPIPQPTEEKETKASKGAKSNSFEKPFLKSPLRSKQFDEKAYPNIRQTKLKIYSEFSAKMRYQQMPQPYQASLHNKSEVASPDCKDSSVSALNTSCTSIPLDYKRNVDQLQEQIIRKTLPIRNQHRHTSQRFVGQCNPDSSMTPNSSSPTPKTHSDSPPIPKSFQKHILAFNARDPKKNE